MIVKVYVGPFVYFRDQKKYLLHIYVNVYHLIFVSDEFAPS